MIKVCVLQPDYGSSQVDYRNYDPPRDLSSLLPEARVDHIFLNKLTTYRQLKELKKQGYDIFVNLCEGYLEWDIPSIDVIHALEALDLPYTGPTPRLYDPPKTLMKYVAYVSGVDAPPYAEVKEGDDLESACRHLAFPLFVKPAKAGDSLGIDERSLAADVDELKIAVAAVVRDYDTALVEHYIDGREFTVLVAGGENPVAYRPLEFTFPEGSRFKTYALKASQWHPERNLPCREPELDARLREAALRIFAGFAGEGYARLDFRLDTSGRLFFLDINFACSVFYTEGYEGSADYILRYDGAGQAGFLRQIIAEGQARHRRKRKKYAIGGNAITGYGLFAAEEIKTGETVWQGEERAHRIATLSHVQATWNPEEQETFRRYAFPVGEEVFILWSSDPADWAPQNHSCDPNTAFRGLNVVALRDIAPGEELTLDYAVFYDKRMAPFACQCGAKQCRGVVRGERR